MSAENKKKSRLRFFCEKLARDKNPERALIQGGKNHGRILSADEFSRELKKKLLEEAEEVAFAKTHDELVSEIVDLQQVIKHIIEINKISHEELAKKTADILELRGSFARQFYSNYVEAEEGSWLANHCLADSSRYTAMPDFKNEEKLTDHCPTWAKTFRDIASKLEETIGEEIIAIHHIGSTAVEGLKARPIIDILVEAKNLLSFDLKRKQIEALGFISYGEFGMIGRRLLVKLDENGHHIAQLHCFDVTDEKVKDYLTFKQILLESQKTKLEYENLKISLAEKHPHDALLQTEEKQRFIGELLAKKAKV